MFSNEMLRQSHSNLRLVEYSFFVPNGPGLELTQRFKDKVNVLNFGYAGRTTENLRDIFRKDIIAKLPKAPLLFTIWLGANDATFGVQGVPIDDYERYLREYVDQIIKHRTWDQKPKVMLIPPPPINVGHYSRKDDEDNEEDEVDLSPTMARAMELEREAAEESIFYRTWKNKRLYAERVMQIADSYPDANVVALDVWTLLTQAACDERGKPWQEGKLPGSGLPGAKKFPEGYFSDGLHFGSKGYKIVTTALLAKIDQTWPELFESLR